MTGIALIGCGYVADYYMGTLPNHPQLELVGVYDRKALRAEKYPLAAKLLGFEGRKVAPVRKAKFAYSGKGADPMDFARGVAELADASREGRPCRMSARHALHVNELTLAIARSAEGGVPHRVRTSFEPMPWASR